MLNINIEKKRFVWLLYWFWAQCNDNWEHYNGLVIQKDLNNTWHVDVDISDTVFNSSGPCHDRRNDEIIFKIDQEKMIYQSSNSSFLSILDHFHDLMEPFFRLDYVVNHLEMDDSALEWLIGSSLCDSNTDKCKVAFGTTDNPGWFVNIVFLNSSKNLQTIDWIEIENSENDWIHYQFKDNVFSAACSPLNLLRVINIFKSVYDEK